MIAFRTRAVGRSFAIGAVLAVSASAAVRAFIPGPGLAAGAAVAWDPSTPGTRVVAAALRQPLRFDALAEPDGGQPGFLSRGGGYALLLGPGSAVVSLAGRRRPASPQAPPQDESVVVRMTWPGARQGVRPAGFEPAPGVTNYLIGSDPSRWRRGVRSFEKVRYEGLYPGIDLVFYGNQEQLEYDFVVAPGGDPRTIRLRFDGGDEVRIDGRGRLVVRAGGTEIVQRAPFIYQERGGARQPVPGRYVKTGRHEVGFAVADYDRTATLFIDPVLTFASFLGGNASNYAKAVAVDSAGYAYVTGYTASTTFPTTAAAYRTVCPTCSFSKEDTFVMKISPSGVLVYSTYVGDDNTDDKAYAIAVDASGNAYVTGETYYPGSGTSFPVVGGFTVTAGGGAFLYKLDATGSSLLYSTQLRSGSSVIGYGVAVQGSSAYVAGMAVAGASFPLWPTAGTYSGWLGGSTQGTYQAFVLKIDTSKTGLASLAYATRFGGWDWNYAYAIAVDAAGEAFVTGYTTSNDFPTAGSPVQPGCGTDGNCNTRVRDVFVSRFNAAGTALVYSTFVGGSKDDIGYGIAIDADGDAFVVGVTYSPDFPVTVGAFDTSCGTNGACDSMSDAFVFALDPTGSGFYYSTFLGGRSSETGRAVAVDGLYNAYVVGDTDSVDFPVTADAIQAARAGTTTDAFTSVIDPTGAVAYSSYLGGSGSVAGGDKAFGIALDQWNNGWVVGQTDSSNFPTQPGAIQTTHGGGQFDGFVVRIGDPVTVTTVAPGGGTTAGGTAATITGGGFLEGASVTFGGAAATSVTAVSPTMITAVTPAHAAGTVDVVVTNRNLQSATLTGGFQYTAGGLPTFTDDPLIARVTRVKAVHLTELRTAVAALRVKYGLTPVTWTDATIAPGTTFVKGAHLAELRTALVETYVKAGRQAPTWSNPTIVARNTVITATHIAELRAAVVAIW